MTKKIGTNHSQCLKLSRYNIILEGVEESQLRENKQRTNFHQAATMDWENDNRRYEERGEKVTKEEKEIG